MCPVDIWIHLTCPMLLSVHLFHNRIIILINRNVLFGGCDFLDEQVDISKLFFRDVWKFGNSKFVVAVSTVMLQNFLNFPIVNQFSVVLFIWSCVLFSIQIPVFIEWQQTVLIATRKHIAYELHGSNDQRDCQDDECPFEDCRGGRWHCGWIARSNQIVGLLVAWVFNIRWLFWLFWLLCIWSQIDIRRRWNDAFLSLFQLNIWCVGHNYYTLYHWSIWYTILSSPHSILYLTRSSRDMLDKYFLWVRWMGTWAK